MTAKIFSADGRRRVAGSTGPAALALLVVLLDASGSLASSGPTAASAPEVAGPARVVSLVPAITETLFALGLGPRLVGVSTYCDYPAAARELPKVGTFSGPVAEAIVALAPDLVLTSPSPGNESAVRAIKRTGVKVTVVQSEGGLDEARSAMLEVAAAVGQAEAGARLVEQIDRRLAAVAASASSLDRPAVAVVVGREPLVLAGPGSYLGELVTLAGGHNVAEAIGGRWPRAGMEFLVVSAPQVIVDLSVSMGEAPATADLLESWSSLPSLPAVASGRVLADRASVMLRPGPRLAEAAEALLAAFHPEAARPSEAAAPGLPKTGEDGGGDAGEGPGPAEHAQP